MGSPRTLCILGALALGVGCTPSPGSSGGGADVYSDEGSDEDSAETSPGPACGDGVVEGAEACDMGSLNSDQGECTSFCALATCGDGFIHQGVEPCDDGNDDPDDACDSCTLPTCGDAILHSGEACDPGLFDSPTCDANCTEALCGDGYINRASGEECDDSNTDNEDGCVLNCRLATCGDGFVHFSEDCDDGNDVDDDSCHNDCEHNYHPLCDESFPELDADLRSPWELIDIPSACDLSGAPNQSEDWLGAGWYALPWWSGMPTTPSSDGCGGELGGYLPEGLPDVKDGLVTRTLCFGTDDEPCTSTVEIQAVECQNFTAVHLEEVPTCDLRYCVYPPIECDD